MTNVSKSVPQDLDDHSKYLVRVRSINNFGVVSDWSDSIIINTETTLSRAGGRLILTEDSIYGYDTTGRLTLAYFGQGVSRTNLARNPSFEINTTGYQANSFSSIAISTEQSRYGTKSLKITPTDTASGIGFSHDVTGRFAVAPDALYTASLYIYNPTSNSDFKIRVGFEFFNAGPSSLGTIWNAQDTLIEPLGEWFRASTIGVEAPPNALTAAIKFASVNPVATTEPFYIDAILIEEEGILREYFDGSTNNGVTTAWAGTAHNSNSLITTDVGDVFLGGNVTIDGYLLVGSAANDIVTHGTTITGGNIATGNIQSGGYVGVTDGSAFSTNGTNINLDNGSVTAEEFRITTAGSAFFKGSLTAASGTFTGALSGATGTFSGSLSAASGTFTGSLSAATGTFAGSLSAATGTFSGSLSAASGTFTGSLSGATGTFSGSLSAASGTFTGTVSAGTITGSTISGGTITGTSISGGSISINSGVFSVNSSGRLTLSTGAAGSLRIRDIFNPSNELEIYAAGNFINQVYKVSGGSFGSFGYDPSGAGGYYLQNLTGQLQFNVADLQLIMRYSETQIGGSRTWTQSQIIIESANGGAATNSAMIAFRVLGALAGYAPIIDCYEGEGVECIRIIKNDNSGYAPIHASAFTVSSSINTKTEIEPVTSILEQASLIQPKRYRRSVRPTTVQVIEGYEEMKEDCINDDRPVPGTDKYSESVLHVCSKTTCGGTPNDPCSIILNDTHEYGLIAEEVYQVFPEMVTINSDKQPIGIDVSQVAAVSWAMARELAAEVENLKARLEALES